MLIRANNPPGESHSAPIIAITGRTQSGKTTVGQRLAMLLCYHHIEMSDFVAARSADARSQGLVVDSTLLFVEHELWHEREFDLVAQDLLTEISRHPAPGFVVTGPRRTEELDTIKAYGSHVLHVHLLAGPEVRWRRQVVDSYPDKPDWPSFVARNYVEDAWGLGQIARRPDAVLVRNEGSLMSAVATILKLAGIDRSAR